MVVTWWIMAFFCVVVNAEKCPVRQGQKMDGNRSCISLLLPRLPKLPSQCCSNGSGNLGNLDTNKEIYSDMISHFIVKSHWPSWAEKQSRFIFTQIFVIHVPQQNMYSWKFRLKKTHTLYEPYINLDCYFLSVYVWPVCKLNLLCLIMLSFNLQLITADKIAHITCVSVWYGAWNVRFYLLTTLADSNKSSSELPEFTWT